MKNQNFSNSRHRYEYFDSSSSRKDIYVYCSGLSEYLFNEKIENIAFMDRSARPAWIGVDTYWKMNFTGHKKPNMYFFNPDGFKQFTGVKKDFKRAFPHLSNQTNKPIVLFDTCSHSGRTMRSVIRTLEKLGFNDVRVITAEYPEMCSDVLDYCVHKIDQHAQGDRGCFPFGRRSASFVEKGSQTVCDAVRDCSRDNGITIRNEIRQIMLDGV